MKEEAGRINLIPDWATVVLIHYKVIESQLLSCKNIDWDAIKNSKEGLLEVGKKFDRFIKALGNLSIGEEIDVSLPSGTKTFKCVSLSSDEKDQKL